MDLDRLDRRRSQLQQFASRRPALETAALRGHDRQQGLAFDLLAAPRFRRTLDLGAEPRPVREGYGLTCSARGR